MEAIVMYPSPGIGHLISMVELGKLILSRHPSFSIIILNSTVPFNTGSTGPYICHVTATLPSITFYDLPAIPLTLDPDSYPSIAAATFDILRLSVPNARLALESISLSTSIVSFIIDLFCMPALTIGSELSIPTFCFFSSGASCLACYLYLPTVHRNTTRSFKDLNMLLHFPGVPPLPSSGMPPIILERSFVTYQPFINFLIQMPKSAGIIVNTFESLEPRALKAISDGLCVSDNPTPPVFCLGPLIASDDRQRSGDREECLKWLDLHPSRSVVFLCFGSLGLFSKEQLEDIAIGLERSGKRFLWVVRSPPPVDKNELFFVPPDPDLDLLLPAGFLDRTRDRGFVVKSWAPQVAVLNHDSIGGFVTHCGWNSVLEAVCAGVPMVAWPLYAEQRLNKVFLVEEMELALPMNESEGGFVTADEVAKRVTELMDLEEGKRVASQAKQAREGARAAMSSNGSSLAALAELVESWKLN
uniref:Glycosyltransferase n=1 Tax=Cyclamen persicum TaxID=87530 RepID=A7M6K1_9ERIC|nr:glucosyltransferase [Cyclamen persicum]